MENEPINARLPRRLWERLKARGTQTGRSAASELRIAVALYLDRPPFGADPAEKELMDLIQGVGDSLRSVGV